MTNAQADTILSLRTTASILSKKSSRKYSIRQDKKDTSVYNITVEEVTL